MEFQMVPMPSAKTNGDTSSLNNTMRQRGLESSRFLSGTQNSNLPFQFNASTRHWRWWNYTSFSLVVIVTVEAILCLVAIVLLCYASEPVTFDIKIYPKIEYESFDTNAPIDLNRESSVYHVTKEFGLATMGGMGSVLTAIAQAQLQTEKITPYVVLPHYSFFKKQEQYVIKKTVDLVTTIRNDQGVLESVGFKVSEFKYDFNPVENFNELSVEEKLAITSEALNGGSKTVRVYLIGPGRIEPFKKAFRASSITGIYSSPRGLPQEWKDQYFNKAVASFLAWKAAGKHEQSLFAPLDKSQPRVDVVHLHGATNAYVAKYLTEYESQLGSTPPAIVYTMHDYLDELQYTNTIENVEKFLNAPRNRLTLKQEMDDVLKPYTFGKKVFMSPLAIDIADMVTFVSKSMAKDMIEGRLDFYLKELVMDSLLHKAEIGQFHGISNGVDFSGSINPFTEAKLVDHNLMYSDYARTLINSKIEQGDTLDKSTTNYWTLSADEADYVTSSKRKSKQFLVDQGLLHAKDIDRPLILFVGRFQYNKGLETFEEAAKLFQSHNMKFAIIGQPNNYPLRWVEDLASRYWENIVLFTRTAEQKDWLIYFRAAADFVYVPSVTESFGLVAAEGLMFGSSVISTGAGGMGEFLVDRRTGRSNPIERVSNLYIESSNKYNAYLFDSSATSGDNQLSEAVRRASNDYQHIISSPSLHEEYVLRMMLSAYGLGWSRGNEQGPVYDYLRLYQKAIEDKRASSTYNLKGNGL